MLLQRAHGGAGNGDYFWANDGDVVEVPDALAQDLLFLAPDEFTDVTGIDGDAEKAAADKAAQPAGRGRGSRTVSE